VPATLEIRSRSRLPISSAASPGSTDGVIAAWSNSRCADLAEIRSFSDGAARLLGATHCLEAGVPVHTVSARLGHVDLRTTAPLCRTHVGLWRPALPLCQGSREFPTRRAAGDGGSEGVDGVAVAAHSVAVAGHGEDRCVVE
jgi:hypothetical protein